MDAITLRKLPPRVAEAIRKRAAERNTSLNRAVIGILEESDEVRSGVAAEERHDLDRLCGVWSPGEGRALERHLAEQRRVDPDLWK